MTTATTDAPARQALTLEITNTCECGFCEVCDVLCVGDLTACDECGADLQPADCGGSCWEDATACLKEMVAAWVSVNPAETGRYWVAGQGMGWRSRTGFRIVDLDAIDAWDVVGVQSEWRQEWAAETWPGGQLTVTQSHHDAMGERYLFRAATEAEVEMHCD